MNKLALLAAAPLSALLIPSPASAQPSPVHYWGTPTYAGAVPTATAYSGAGRVTQIATANGAWYALRSNGAVVAWGDNLDGEFGDGAKSGFTQTPARVAFPVGVQIAYLSNTGPQGSMLAVDITGHAWGWGFNRWGELCTGNTKHQLVPFAIPVPAPVTAIAGAGDHAFFESGGVTYACGANGHGDMGTGTGSTTPIVVPLPGPATALYASWENSGAIVDGTLYSWGYGAKGGVGNGTTSDADSPVAISLPAPVASAAFGGSLSTNGNALALTTDGALYAWGFDGDGQLGDNAAATQSSPEFISTPAPYVTVEAAGQSGYGITADGDLYAWGDASKGQFGVRRTGSPMVIATGIAQVSATANVVEDKAS